MQSRHDFVETDVSLGPRTQLVLDAHQIPYAAGSFDAVVVQAVLEHVLNPQQCVAEIHRVLRTGGLVYADTPFMQQVHGGPYDFTRFTRSGHRMLFRAFDEVDSGASSGPGTALGWAWQYLWLSLAGNNGTMQLAAKTFARFTGFWMKYLDGLAGQHPRALDGACGLYFIGRRADGELTDRQILAYYR